MTPEIQLELWLAGNPVHNKDRDECCPDFSCCCPELLAPLEARELFIASQKSGNEALRFRLLGEFLNRAFASRGVYVAGMLSSQMEVCEPKGDTK